MRIYLPRGYTSSFRAKKREQAHMTVFTNPLIAILILIFLLLLLVLFLIIAGEMMRNRQRASRTCTQAITVTITDIHIEAGNLSNSWVITARWSSPSSPQPLVFVSPHLSHRPHYRRGDALLLYINPNNPSDYYMPLDD